MNIAEAKNQIEETVEGYLTRDETGAYLIAPEAQRPLFLLGAPGIGKTAVVGQVARELGIGLVSYSMTHHTRQSALGLPFIVHKRYGDEEFDVSEYTMSEIIASIYDYREEAGHDRGILFLDEINSMSVAMQAKLLRALQEKCVRPVGSLKEEPIRCRLICASNETVETLLQENRMRRDLFYRISDFVLTIPPLRERREDILDLSEMFIRRYNREFRKNISGISPALRSRLLNGDWNGNTRELEHVIRNLMLRISELDTELTEDGYPAYLPRKTKDAPFTSMQISVPLPEALRRFQRELILRALEQHQWNLSQTALSLGIQRQNLTQRMLRLGITAE